MSSLATLHGYTVQQVVLSRPIGQRTDVISSVLGMNTDESKKMDEERTTSGKSSNVQNSNELRSVLVEMEHSQKSMGRSEWADKNGGEADGWACL